MIKVGDMVRVKTLAEIDKYLWDEVVIGGMYSMLGKTCKVKSVRYDNKGAAIYTPDGTDYWYFHFDMIEEIKEENTNMPTNNNTETKPCTTLTFTETNGEEYTRSVSISSSECGMSISSFVDEVIIPMLKGVGYSENLVNEVFGSDEGGVHNGC